MATMRERVAELEARRAKVREMGGPEKVAKHHERGKLTARERMTLLFDGGEFVEIGIHGTEMGPGAQAVPADAVVCGWGKINGRHVAAAAYELGISETTARQHLSGLYRRTGCVNAAQAAYLLGSSDHVMRARRDNVTP